MIFPTVASYADFLWACHAPKNVCVEGYPDRVNPPIGEEKQQQNSDGAQFEIPPNNTRYPPRTPNTIRKPFQKKQESCFESYLLLNVETYIINYKN